MGQVIAIIAALACFLVGCLVPAVLVRQQRLLRSIRDKLHSRSELHDSELVQLVLRHNEYCALPVDLTAYDDKEAIEAFECVAAEVGVKRGFLRPEDRLYELLPPSVPFMLNYSLDRLSSYLPEHNHRDQDIARCDICTVCDFVLACATSCKNNE